MKKVKKKLPPKKDKVGTIPGHAATEEQIKNAHTRPTTQMVTRKEFNRQVEKRAKQAPPITYHLFNSYKDNNVIKENRRSQDWRTEIIPRFSTPMIVKDKTEAPAFVPATFAPGTLRRKEHVWTYNMLVIDVDNEKLNKKGRPKDHHHPLGVYSMLEGKMEFFIYTTFSNINKRYTDTKPREVIDDWHAKFRVMIPLATPVPFHFYEEAKPFLKAKFKFADPSTFDAVHLFNVPSILEGNEHNFSCYHGKGFFFDLNNHVAEIQRFKTNSLIKTTDYTLNIDNEDVKDMDLKEAKHHLFKIDPDLEHNAWIRAGFFLRIVFYPKGLDKEAFALFDEWSSTGKKYREKKAHEDMQTVWEGFPTEGVMSSIGVLKNIAKEYPLTVQIKETKND